MIISQEEYCVDAIWEGDSYIHAVFICGDFDENDSDNILHYVYVTGKFTLLIINYYVVIKMYLWLKNRKPLDTKYNCLLIYKMVKNVRYKTD